MILAGGQKGSKTIENIFKAFFIWLTVFRPPALPTTELQRKTPPSYVNKRTISENGAQSHNGELAVLLY